MKLSAAPGSLPAGRRVYAIGDVHGCLEQLVALHYSVATDLAARPVAESVLIHVGDYIDRGPDSAGVIWLLAGTVAPAVTHRVNLMGNHEAMMLAALREGNRQVAGHWLENGGAATLESYQVSAQAMPEQWNKAIPASHQAWLSQLEVAHWEGSYLFVHAGIRPGKPFSSQTALDMLWIREPFLSDREARDAIVVHGHTPSAMPEVFANRIGIDTGAVMGAS